MAITASMVKELRERTGAGMMDCKKALVETDGNIDQAIENMRKSGAAKAEKKAGRTAADGLVIIKVSDDGKNGVILEVNCETDFVAKDDNFASFANAVAQRILESKPADIDALLALPLHEGEATTIEETRQALIAKIGENMNVRRFELVSTEHRLNHYLHGVRIGVLIEMKGGDEALARDIAMHIAAQNPICLAESDMSADLVAKERDIIATQSRDSGKPENIIEKMVDGRMKKFFAENTLLGQSFIKEPDTTVGKLVASKGAEIQKYIRFEVGEGIEVKKEDFAAEVKAAAGG